MGNLIIPERKSTRKKDLNFFLNLFFYYFAPDFSMFLDQLKQVVFRVAERSECQTAFGRG